MMAAFVDELEKIGVMKAPTVSTLTPKLPTPGKAPSIAQIKSKVMKPNQMGGGMKNNFSQVNSSPPPSPQGSMMGGVISPKAAPAPGISYGVKG